MHYLDYPEQQVFNGKILPCFFYKVDKNYSRYNMPFHWHPLYELIHVYEGCFELYIDQKTYRLSAGDTAIIPGGFTHGGTPDERSNCQYYCLLVDIEAVALFSTSIRSYEPRLTNLFNGTLMINFYFPSSDEEVNELVCRLLKLFESPSKVDMLSIVGYLYLLFACILRNHLYTKVPPKYDIQKYASLKNALSYIEEHYQEKITLEALAASANLSPNYFCRYFKELTHRSPIDYLNYFRTEVACSKMQDSTLSITEIASECGFSDPSYFVKVFRHYKHVSPTQYQNGHKKQ